MGNEREMYPKANFRMKIVSLEKTEDNNYKVVDSKWVKSSGRKFMESVKEDRANGMDRTIEIVNAEPEKFKVNQIYMLRNREVVWIYKEV